MKACTLSVFLLFSIATFSQNTINSYKYVLVPERFDFSHEDNQYGLNNTAKLMLESKGFTAFLDNEQLPPAVAANKCNALRAEVTQRKGFFVTNLTITLKDCQGNILFKSKEGKSREKEFPVAYNEALRDAFSSLTDYKYDSTGLTIAQQQVTSAPAAPAAPVNPSSAAPAASASFEITGTLYAQQTANGYQLVDTSPKKVLTLLKTSIQDYYIAEAGAINGMAFKKDGEWFFEYYKDNKLVSQKLDIKF